MKAKAIVTLVVLTLLLAGATARIWQLHGCPKTGIDDANIFFTYAENLADGKGISYGHNGERVEGFTSMLWMLVCALMFALGANETGVFGCCFGLLVLTHALFLKAIGRSAEHAEGLNTLTCSGIYMALVLASPAYLTWMTITLMDVSLWGCVVAGMTLAIVLPPRSKTGSIIAFLPFLLAPATRPEAFLVAPVFVVLLWLRCQTTGMAHATRTCLFLLLSVIVVASALTVFRMRYFGFPLPNTFYAKVSPSLLYNLREGRDYLYGFMQSSSVAAVCCLLAAIQAASWIGQVLDRLRRGGLVAAFRWSLPAHSAVSLGAITLLIVPVLTGGDHFRTFRFFQPVWPLLALAVVLHAREVWPRSGAGQTTFPGVQWWRENLIRGAAVGVVLSYAFFAYASEVSWASLRWGRPIAHEFGIAEGGVVTGTRLNRIFAGTRPMPSVGVVTAGGIARTYAGRIVDVMGLNNAVIGHFRGDRQGIKNHAAFEREAFFKTEPDIFLAEPPVPPETNNCYTACLKGLMDDPRFTGRWRYGAILRTNDPQASVSLFVKDAFLNGLPREAALEFHDTMIWSNKWVVR